MRDFSFQDINDLAGLSKRRDQIDDPERCAAGEVCVFQRLFCNRVFMFGAWAETGERDKSAWKSILPEDVVLPQSKRRFERIQNLRKAARLMRLCQTRKIEHRTEIGVLLGRNVKPVFWECLAQNTPDTLRYPNVSKP